MQEKTQQKFDRSIVDGPIGGAVWRLAWPTMLQNVIAGVQGIIDHVMVGHYVGYTGNAAIGVEPHLATEPDTTDSAVTVH